MMGFFPVFILSQLITYMRYIANHIKKDVLIVKYYNFLFFLLYS